MLKFVIAFDPRPHAKSGDFVRVSQGSDRVFVGLFFHARKRVTFSGLCKDQKHLVLLAEINFMPLFFATFFHEEPYLRTAATVRAVWLLAQYDSEYLGDQSW